MVNLVTVQLAAQRLQIAPEVLRRMIRRGIIPAIRLGPRRIRISEQQLDDFVQQHRVVAAEGVGE